MTGAELSTILRRRPRLRVELPSFAESAVLIPLIVDAAGDASVNHARLVFTERRADLRTHAGQIAFPGGRRDPDDADLVATALREAEEEIGLPRDRVEVLGSLDDVPTPSRFVITPVVALVHGPVVLAPHAGEVASVFDCTLEGLGDPACYRDKGNNAWQGIEFVMHEYHVGPRRIWGATARIVHQLLGLVATK